MTLDEQIECKRKELRELIELRAIDNDKILRRFDIGQSVYKIRICNSYAVCVAEDVPSHLCDSEIESEQIIDELNFYLLLNYLKHTYKNKFKKSIEANKNINTDKYYILYRKDTNTFYYNLLINIPIAGVVYFESAEFADEICNILNDKFINKDINKFVITNNMIKRDKQEELFF